MNRTVAILSIGLITTCLCLDQAQTQPPTAASSGRKGTAMNSSLINPLNMDELDDGIFPGAAAAALKGPGQIIPSLARIGEASIAVSVQVNGFSLDSLGQLLVEDGEPIDADYLRIAPIHPYFLNPGKNVIRTGAGAGGAIAIVGWDYVHGSEHEELLRITLPSEGQQTFSWMSKVPKRPWATGAKIEASEAAKQRLYAEISGLHARLQALSTAAANHQPTDDASVALRKELSESIQAFVEASELRGKPYRLIDQMLEAATVRARPGDPPGSLELQPLPPEEEVELELFAGRTLARLKQASSAPLFAFTSNLPDGPRGRTGTTVLAFDAWYRQNDQGGWELDALFPRVAPGTWTQFEVGPYELEELFRLSNF